MSLLPFADEEELPPQAARLAPLLRSQADKGIFWGTSSWKYDGWVGSIYSDKRYETRNKFSKKKFEETCLSEYAKTFPIVCGDFAFYQFPSPDYWKKLFESTPSDFLFAFKVPEELTVPKWPTHARYGNRAGKVNENFLNPKIFSTYFVERLKSYQERVAVLIFEFGTFAKATFPTPVDFFAMLDPFLASLPTGFRYSIEIRNPEYLGSDYFSLLSSHNTAHVFSAWTRMPELKHQLDLGDSMTADFTVARALLMRHRNYEEAVKTFEPYGETHEVNPGARDALKELAVTSIKRKKPAFLFVNNRLEGNAPSTIEAVVQSIEG